MTLAVLSALLLAAAPIEDAPLRKRTWEDILVDYDEAARERARRVPAYAVPEAYELATIILSLTPVGAEATASTSYAEAVEARFGAFRDHPAVHAASRGDRPEEADGFFDYIEFRENAYAYCFDEEQADPDRLYRCQPFSHVWGRQNNSFARNLDLIEDFARVSGFRTFYAESGPYYTKLTEGFADRADVLSMRDWLSARFPVRVDAMQVALSPLTDGTHSTQRFEDDDFVSVAMFVQPVDDVPMEEGYEVERMLFTELDHNYVNPTISEEQEAELDTGVFADPYWVEGGSTDAYGSGFAVFAEYATWALFELWALRETDTPPDVLKSYLDGVMHDRRGFVRYRAFASEMMQLYEEAEAMTQEPVQIPSLYPNLIAWGQETVRTSGKDEAATDGSER